MRSGFQISGDACRTGSLVKQFFATFAVSASLASGCLRFKPTACEQQLLDAKGAEFAKDAEYGNSNCLRIGKAGGTVAASVYGALTSSSVWPDGRIFT